eukprot:TRINITY_DN7788_c0_g1_i1.p2 TRINITY_DN7788_c0_g1~~TRINITY_DN7788_c0_g1_i1.p2  ORF type:complete len:181 (+),score=44.39 TRINITY_DN7788_c0_g1_i1:142-684(+)
MGSEDGDEEEAGVRGASLHNEVDARCFGLQCGRCPVCWCTHHLYEHTSIGMAGAGALAHALGRPLPRMWDKCFEGCHASPPMQHYAWCGLVSAPCCFSCSFAQLTCGALAHSLTRGVCAVLFFVWLPVLAVCAALDLLVMVVSCPCWWLLIASLLYFDCGNFCSLISEEYAARDVASHGV